MSHNADVQKILFSKRDAALALSLSVRTIENLIHRKELIARRVGRRTLILASSLESFAQRGQDSPSAQTVAPEPELASAHAGAMA